MTDDYLDIHPRDGRPMTSGYQSMIRDVDALFVDAISTMEKAMREYPQPNYVASKLGEEAGEVIRAYVHRAEGRATTDDLRNETVQLIALALRLYYEGDRTVDAHAPDLSGST